MPPYADSLELVRGYQATGDRALLNSLIERYYERIRRIARIRMGAVLQEWAESDDLVQETFTAAFDRIEELDLQDHSSLIRYLSTVLENKIRGALAFYGAQKRQPSGGTPLSVDELGSGGAIEPPASEPGPLETAEARELSEIYDACVQSLEPHHRDVILLREYEECTWAEVRDALGRPSIHSARLLHSRAQIRLAEIVRRRLTPSAGEPDPTPPAD